MQNAYFKIKNIYQHVYHPNFLSNFGVITQLQIFPLILVSKTEVLKFRLQNSARFQLCKINKPIIYLTIIYCK